MRRHSTMPVPGRCAATTHTGHRCENCAIIGPVCHVHARVALKQLLAQAERDIFKAFVEAVRNDERFIRIQIDGAIAALLRDDGPRGAA